MDDFSYSVDAENVLSQFYQADFMVYVEGPDDICFWEIMFNKFSDYKVEIQDVGGCNELKPYIEKVINNEIECLVACDSDLKVFDPDFNDNSKILRTYGYAIENTFITAKTLSHSLKNIGKLSVKGMRSVNVEKWFALFNEKLVRLIILDIYNFVERKGIAVVGDNADRFMKTKTSYDLCDDKILGFIESLPQDFINYDINSVEGFIEKVGVSTPYWIRGHFLFSASHRFLSAYLNGIGKKISLSYEALYASLIAAFELVFNDTHEQYEFYKSQIEKTLHQA